MNIDFFCPRWGSEELAWPVFLDKVIAAGYQGVEYGVPNDASEQELETVWNLTKQRNIPIIPQHFGTYEADFQAHSDAYSAWFEKIKPYAMPFVNSQTGKDFFSVEQNKSLIDIAAAFTKATGVKVYHETHRNKFGFAAHIARQYLEALPNLRITLDASHWVCVAESYLADQPEALQLAIERTDHIHARVGYPEGPQISDPRVPEWQEAVEVHLGWWDKVVALKEQENQSLTITPEFGPYPYLVRLPFTCQPLVSQWEVNVHMMELLRERYCT